MNSMKVTFNGTLITGRIDGMDTFDVTLRQNDASGQTARSFTSELTFYDDGYDLIKTLLIDSPTGFTNKIDVKIFDDCCSQAVFKGVIKGDSIDWCEPDCSATANIIEDTPQIDCVQSKVIDIDLINIVGEPTKIVQINYCLEGRPKWWHVAIGFIIALISFLVSVILIPFIVVIMIISSVIYILCSIVCAIPFTDCNQNTCDSSQINPSNTWDLMEEGITELLAFFDTCNRKHPSGLVREYINHVCVQCGLTFQSSILNDPSSTYYNSVLFAAGVEKGNPENLPFPDLIAGNKPIETLETFLDNILKPVFNSEWRVSGNNLIFERKDYFFTTTQWIDTEMLLAQNRIVDNKICYSWIDRERWAFGRFEYQPDSIDIIGNEAMPRYNDIVDWYSGTWQKGQYIDSLPIGAARFRSDGVDGEGTVFEIMGAIQGGFWALFFGANFLGSNNDALLMNQHTAMNYKLLLWDGVSDENSVIQHHFDESFTGGPVLVNGETIDASNLWNYPFWFKAENTNNLYSNFHFIDDPRVGSSQKFNFDFTFEFTCDDLTNFQFSKSIRLVQNGNVKFGQISEVKVNFINRTMTVSGIV